MDQEQLGMAPTVMCKRETDRVMEGLDSQGTRGCLGHRAVPRGF